MAQFHGESCHGQCAFQQRKLEFVAFGFLDREQKAGIELCAQVNRDGLRCERHSILSRGSRRQNIRAGFCSYPSLPRVGMGRLIGAKWERNLEISGDPGAGMRARTKRTAEDADADAATIRKEFRTWKYVARRGRDSGHGNGLAFVKNRIGLRFDKLDLAEWQSLRMDCRG